MCSSRKTPTAFSYVMQFDFSLGHIHALQVVDSRGQRNFRLHSIP
jgi:hypothetical protein